MNVTDAIDPTRDGPAGRYLPADRVNEDRIASQISSAWHCSMRRYPAYSLIDFYAEREGNVVANVEVRCRSHALGAYPSVLLSVPKYLTMHAASIALGVPSLYVWGFADDEVRWVDVTRLAPRAARVLSRAQGPRINTEPVLHIELAELMALS